MEDGLLTSGLLWGLGALAGIMVVLFIASLTILHRCDSDKIMVKSGAFCGKKGCKIYLGGITTILPMLQSVRYMSRQPLSISINMEEAISKNKIRVQVPCNFQVALSEDPERLERAASRIVAMSKDQMVEKVKEILTGGLRVVIAQLTIEQINDDRNAFVQQVDTQVEEELAKLGFDITNVNIEEIDDEAGYLKALGQKAASAALNKANVEVAEQDKLGQIGVKTNESQRDIEIQNQETARAIGTANAQRERDVRVAEMESQAAVEKIEFEKSKIDAQATLAVERELAEQKERVAQSKAQQALLEEQKKEERLRLEKEKVAEQEIAKLEAKLQAEARAESRIIEAKAAAEGIKIKAEADAEGIKLKYETEAAGQRAVMEAQAEGYAKLFSGGNTEAILAFEQLKIAESLETIRASAISNLEIDEIKVIDSGNGSSIPAFVQGLMGTLPRIHSMSESAGIQLPSIFGVNGAEGPQKPSEAPESTEDSAGEMLTAVKQKVDQRASGGSEEPLEDE